MTDEDGGTCNYREKTAGEMDINSEIKERWKQKRHGGQDNLRRKTEDKIGQKLTVKEERKG